MLISTTTPPRKHQVFEIPSTFFMSASISSIPITTNSYRRNSNPRQKSRAMSPSRKMGEFAGKVYKLLPKKLKPTAEVKSDVAISENGRILCRLKNSSEMNTTPPIRFSRFSRRCRRRGRPLKTYASPPGQLADHRCARRPHFGERVPVRSSAS